VRGAENLARVEAIAREERHSDASGQEDFASSNRQRLSGPLKQPCRGGGGCLFIARAGHQHDKLVASEAGDQPIGRHSRNQTRGELTKNGIACLVAEEFVQVAEPVQTKDKDGAGLTTQSRVIDELLEAGFEQPSSRQSGQYVKSRYFLAWSRSGHPFHT
jgi:hypothetical protein